MVNVGMKWAKPVQLILFVKILFLDRGSDYLLMKSTTRQEMRKWKHANHMHLEPQRSGGKSAQALDPSIRETGTPAPAMDLGRADAGAGLNATPGALSRLWAGNESRP